jgi:cytochrome c-type biogenesis protein CcmH/NrfF
VISVFAVSLPIILAVMGVIVALKPPSTAMLWVWVVAFIIVGLIAIVVNVIDRRNADDAIKGLNLFRKVLGQHATQMHFTKMGTLLEKLRAPA